MLMAMPLVFTSCSDDDDELVYEYKLVDIYEATIPDTEFAFRKEYIYPLDNSICDNVWVYQGDYDYEQTNSDSKIYVNGELFIYGKNSKINTRPGILYIVIPDQKTVDLIFEFYVNLDQHNRDIRGKQYEVIKR